MFWRIFFQLLRANRARLLLALVALAGGAAVSSALLNIHFDAERKLTQEFRALGANVVVSPPRGQGGSDTEPPLADATVLERIAAARTTDVVAAAPYLYAVARVGEKPAVPVIVAGTWLDEVRPMASWWQVTGEWIVSRNDLQRCLVGIRAAKQMSVAPGSQLELRAGQRTERLTVAGIASVGGAEDNQVFVNLPVAQHLAGREGKIALVQISVAGSTTRINSFVAQLGRALPGMEVRPIRQLAEAEGQLLSRIRVLIFSTVALILALTTLCVLATMTALAMEHRRDVGLMKALGGAMPRVVRLFLTEAALLGVLGGVLGWAGGIALSAWIGRNVFGAPISMRLDVLPLTVALMTGVALTGALPLRLLGRVRPAVILRGD